MERAAQRKFLLAAARKVSPKPAALKPLSYRGRIAVSLKASCPLTGTMPSTAASRCDDEHMDGATRSGRTMVNVLLFLGGLAILLVSSRQVFLMFRDGSFRARGNRLIVRNAHPIIFWMTFVGLVLFGIVGVALMCWQLLT
jgi:hypothetical protein